MAGQKPLPPLRSVRAALRNVTLRLTAELDRATSHGPDWSELEWRLAPAVAAIHGISGLLATQLQWRRPERWTAFLAEQRDSTAQRYRAARESLALIGELARRDGVAITYLKGAALYSLGLYAPGERPMADLDFLVRPADLPPVHQILTSLGYQELGASWKHRSYRLEAPGAPIRLGEDALRAAQIDLHTRLAERLPHQVTDLSDLILSDTATPGLNGYPSVAALMIHVLAHAAGSMVQRELRLIQLVDVVRISSRMTPQDWDQILGYDGPNHRLWWASPPVMMASRSFPHWEPPAGMKVLWQGCPRRLQQAARRWSVTDTSYSHIAYDPFPGIAWTRSNREALSYIVDRIRHARAQLAGTRLLVDTETWQAGNSGAYRSQLSRVVRGLVSRPLRTAAMRVVRAALEEPVS